MPSLSFSISAILIGVALVAGSPPATRAEEPVSVTFVEACPAGPARSQVTAVGLRVQAPAAQTAPAANVIVLVDTSASQTGEYRRRSLDAVAGLLEKGRKADRFALAAVDVGFTPLTDAFFAPGDEALRSASRTLDGRAPLGSTDIVLALEQAAEQFPDDKRPRAVVYIGDGPGLIGVDGPEFARVVDLLRTKQIAVSSIGIGPQVNWPCLAAIASSTGGAFLLPEGDFVAKQVGSVIGLAAIAPVAWPVEAAVSGDVKRPDAAPRMLPKRLPPLRADRDAVVLIEGPPEGLGLRTTLLRGDQKLTAKVAIPPAVPREENAYLAELTRNAAASDGVFLPLLGREGLDAARGVIRGEAATLATLSRQAEASGAHDSAVRLAEASLRRDPDNPDASLVRLVARRQAVEAEDTPPAAMFGEQADGELADLEANRRIQAQVQEQEAAVKLRAARQLLARDPEQAREDLKELRQSLGGNDSLDAAAKQRLLAQIDMKIREATIRAREKTDRDLDADRRAAIGRERTRLNGELQRREEKIKQLTERYNALVEEGIRIGYTQSENYPTTINGESVIGNERPTDAFKQAERSVAEEINREAPDIYANHPIPITARVVGRTAPLVARILDYDAENARTKRDMERGFMDSLHTVDVAAIPYPDEPPITYPNAARWKELTESRKRFAVVNNYKPGSNEERIYKAFEDKIGNFEFEETPLRDVIQVIRDEHRIPVVIDQKALEAANLTPDMPISSKLSDMSLRSALRNILGQVDLTYVVKDEVLKITTREQAEQELEVRVYPVADLVLPIDQGTGVNPFQMGGGLGGQQGMGMGGGMGGMGMGGGMGGMGMGGGMGGGFCWVAREVYGAHDPRWLVFRGWMIDEAPAWLRDLYGTHGPAVADWIHDKPAAKAALREIMNAIVEPRLTASAAPAGLFQISGSRSRLARRSTSRVVRASATEDAPATEERAGLPTDVLDAKDLRATLAAYLAPSAGKTGAAADREVAARMAKVRVSAADLGRLGRFERAADLITAAIACDHAEPWMYESLGIALEAAGRSRDEIERVLLSSADFARSPVELLQLANYLARFGSDAQAIRICRQVTRLDPANREAFALAMAVAARTDDSAALAWACPGVLAHEWPVGQRDVATRAARLAKATIAKLSSTGRDAEAKAFRAAVDAALVRDLVIEISWAGDADIDVAVEEPTSTVCSLVAPRSTSGGTLLADGHAGDDDKVHREVYVAGEAFPGQYRVLVSRSPWGTVAADTITAEMTIHKGTDREQKLRRQIRVGADDQVLAVNVPEGRRREPLLDAQVAQDAATQMGIGRAVLAQQLASISDPAALAAMSQSRGGSAIQPIPGLPFFGGGAVGYQPQIRTLPEGANMSARAVITADRRYVRVNAVPLFSLVGQVTQFNFAGGGAQGGAGGAAPGQGAAVGAGVGGVQGGAGGGLGQGGGGFGQGGGGFGQGGGGLGAAGGAAGLGAGGGQVGGIGGICWVAREVYGHDDPRWMTFRGWLTTEAPIWLLDAYVAHGEEFAVWIHDKPAAKAVVRALMDRAISGRVAAPCPVSE